VSDGSNPAICHVHRAQQAGKPVGALTEVAPFDAERKLLKIAANDRHPQQLQALKLLRERNNCEVCAARANEGDTVSTLLRYANDEQRAALSLVWINYSAVKDDIRACIANGAASQPMDNRS
jgi:hypothetical protein